MPVVPAALIAFVAYVVAVRICLRRGPGEADSSVGDPSPPIGPEPWDVES